MKAALLTDFSAPLSIENVPDPQCPQDGAIIQVQACGVCRSDHHAWKGVDPDVKLPHVMGHEFAGTIVETGPECREWRTGDRVTAPFILGCGHCSDCRAGEPTICHAQKVIGFSQWGAFAEYAAIGNADYNLVRLPDQMGFAAAAGMGCRVTTAFRAVVDRGALAPGEWLAVHGCGGVGLSAIMIAKAIGARVVAIDVNDTALALARDMGADETLLATDPNTTGDSVRSMTEGGAHVSVDALGITATFHASLMGLRKLGRHVQIGMPVGAHATPQLPLLDLVYARQLSLLGSRGMGAARFPALFAMIASGAFDPARMVSQEITLSGLESALRTMDGFTGTGVTVVTNLTS